jgi:hypothetical protein
MQHTTLTRAVGTGVLGLTAALVVGVTPAQAALPSPTTTTLDVKPVTLAYGETAKATVTVDSTLNGPKPDGSVSLRIGDRSVTATLANSGKATLDVPLVDAAITPYAVSAAYTPADANAYAPSTSAPVAVTVTKDATTSTVTAVHKRRKHRIVARDAVVSAHGQVPTGTAKIKLFRNGHKVAVVRVALNARGVAKARFLHVRNKGLYKVRATYLDSTNFTRSKDGVTVP